MNRFWKAVLLTTLVAGTLDIIAAHIHVTITSGQFPTKMFYAIAGGAIGQKTAFSGGPLVFVLGVFIHYFISLCFTLFFFLVYPAVYKVLPNKYVNGLLFTLFAWLTMNFIVLPLTALPQKPFILNINKVIGFLIFIVVFGMPISIMTDKYYKSRIIGGNKAKIRA
jgi:uncharacterized membrane protein YagU involved in acid resistance